MTNPTNIKRLERAALDAETPIKLRGCGLHLYIEAKNVSDELDDGGQVPPTVAALARCLYWIARIAGRLGYSLDELAKLCVDEELA